MKRIKALALLLILFSSLFISGSIHTVHDRHRNEKIYYSSGSTDAITVLTDNYSALIYNGSSSDIPVYNLLGELSENRITYLDSLIFTSVTETEFASAEKIISSLKVGKIYLPSPRSDTEKKTCENITKLLSRYGTTLSFYGIEEIISLGDEKFIMLARSTAIGDDYYTDSVCLIGTSEDYTLYATTGFSDTLYGAFMKIAPSVDTIFIGGRGKGYYRFSLKFEGVRRVLYSKYCILDENTLAFYEKNGASTEKIEAPVNIKR